jgi:hypothetical protein
LHRLAYKFGLRLARIRFVRGAIDERADLSGFDHKPTVKLVAGLFLIVFSFIIGWPAISGLGALAIYYHRPRIAVIGSPILYGFSHVCYIAGMALAGAKYARLFFRWLARVWVERLLSHGRGATPKVEALGPESGRSV